MSCRQKVGLRVEVSTLLANPRYRAERPISAIVTHDVLTIVEPLWQEKTETAIRVLNRRLRRFR
jgi:hypothetical protein